MDIILLDESLSLFSPEEFAELGIFLFKYILFTFRLRKTW